MLDRDTGYGPKTELGGEGDLVHPEEAPVNHWHPDYECAHCHRSVHIAVTAPWPKQCPHCRVWHPVLRSVGRKPLGS